ncbi:hypothetical protein D9756_003024 [Leucocoprinus leucothites]|uniref:DUF6534 domain-containing protein n=1 Tax=Leucocoprinus leucothites TaxID=201217 RepID=A0A8H5G7D1_9AGAR|nr:hypothetical protein D9756_003024 [Leucoagaricus leucothites]
MATAGIDHTLEYMEIGAMVSMVLFGMSTVQVYMYFSECRSDRKRIKVFVSTSLLGFIKPQIIIGPGLLGRLPVATRASAYIHLRLFDCLCQHIVKLSFLLFLNLYPQSTITYSDRSLKLAHLHRVSMYSGMVATTITSCSQIWFAYRLLKLSDLKIYPCFCMFLSGVKFVSFYVLTIYKIVTVNTNKLSKYFFVIPSVAACAADLLIAGGLIWCLWARHKERIFSQRTPVDRILVWCLETNLLTCVSVSVAFVFVSYDDIAPWLSLVYQGYSKFEISTSGVKVNYIWLTLSYVNCRLYSMCLFASLIAKKRLDRDRPTMFSLDSELAIGVSDQSPLAILASPPGSAPASKTRIPS